MAKRKSKAADALADLSPYRRKPYLDRIDPGALAEIREALELYASVPRQKRPCRLDVARALIAAYDLDANANALSNALPRMGWPE